MSDIRQLLEREEMRFSLPSGAMDRFVEHRIRRRRNRRIGTAALAFVLTAATVWGVAAAFRGVRSPPGPAATLIGPLTVDRLRLAWTANVQGKASTPVVAAGMVYVAADRLYAFPATCGHGCPPAWVGDIGVGGDPRTPTVSGGVVYAANDRLYAYPARCGTGGGICMPMWRSRPAILGRFSAPAVADGVVYASTLSSLQAYAASCGSRGSICDPLWTASFPPGEEIPVAPPSVGNGEIYVMSHTTGLHAFAVGCGAKGPCRASWTAPGLDANSTATVVAGGTVFVSAGSLYAFRSHCATGGSRCRPLWFSSDPSNSQLEVRGATPAVVSDGLALVGGDRIYALPAGCGTGNTPCPTTWAGTTQFDRGINGVRVWATPAVMNGLVFSATDRPSAFAVRCGRESSGSGAVCPPVWTGPARRGQILSAPAMTATTLYLTSSEGLLLAYEVS